VGCQRTAHIEVLAARRELEPGDAMTASTAPTNTLGGKMHLRTWAIRTATLIVAMAGSVALLALPATAAPVATVHGTFNLPIQEFDDPDVCAAEGFTIHAVMDESGVFNYREDAGGELAGLMVHHDIAFAISANGRTVYEHDHYNNFFYPDGTSIAVGNETHVLGEHGEIVLLDAGRIVFDADGNPTFIAGPHPQFLGAAQFCVALLP
jgi:hypothetical protein